MKHFRFLFVFLFTSLLLHIIQAQDACINTPLKVETLADGSFHKYCEYKENVGTQSLQLLPGSSFTTKSCDMCTCSTAGLRCCQQPKAPVDIPAGCKVIIDGCSYLVVSQVDYNTDCYTGLPVSQQTSKVNVPAKLTNKNQNGNDMVNLLFALMIRNMQLRQMVDPEYEPPPEEMYRSMNGEMTSMDSRMRYMNGGMGYMNGGMGYMNGGLRSMNDGMRSLNGEMRYMNGGMRSMNGEMRYMNGGSKQFPFENLNTPAHGGFHNNLGMDMYPNFGENSGLSMFFGEYGPLERMILNDIMAVNLRNGRQQTQESFLNNFANKIALTTRGVSSAEIPVVNSDSRLVTENNKTESISATSGGSENAGTIDTALSGSEKTGSIAMVNNVSTGSEKTGNMNALPQATEVSGSGGPDNSISPESGLGVAPSLLDAALSGAGNLGSNDMQLTGYTGLQGNIGLVGTSSVTTGQNSEGFVDMGPTSETVGLTGYTDLPPMGTNGNQGWQNLIHIFSPPGGASVNSVQAGISSNQASPLLI